MFKLEGFRKTKDLKQSYILESLKNFSKILVHRDLNLHVMSPRMDNLFYFILFSRMDNLK